MGIESINEMNNPHEQIQNYNSLIDNFEQVFEDFIVYRGIERKKILLYGDSNMIKNINLVEKICLKFNIEVLSIENIFSLL